MARYKLDVQKRQHRERSQPLNRQRLGLLEKHKDYVKRARDYHSKQDRIKTLRQKASLKNPDEFYFEMLSSRTEKDGVHVKSRGNKALENDLVKLLKTQDFNYVKTCRSIEENKINKLKEHLGSMVNEISNEESDSTKTLKSEVIKLIHKSISATHASNPERSDAGQSGYDEGTSSDVIPMGKKTIFVDSAKEVLDFKPELFGKKKKEVANVQPKTTPKSPNMKNRKGKSKEEISDAQDDAVYDASTNMRNLLTELKSRLSRLSVLQTAERELEIKRALMGNGSKFLKNATRVPKLKGLINGRDLSWYDKLDRNALIEEDEEKERLEKLNSGIKTGAKVWKWKAERKR